MSEFLTICRIVRKRQTSDGPYLELEVLNAKADENSSTQLPQTLEKSASSSQPRLDKKKTSRRDSTVGNTRLSGYSWRPGNP